MKQWSPCKTGDSNKQTRHKNKIIATTLLATVRKTNFLILKFQLYFLQTFKRPAASWHKTRNAVAQRVPNNSKSPLQAAGTSLGMSCRYGGRRKRFSGSSAANTAAATSDFNLGVVLEENTTEVVMTGMC